MKNILTCLYKILMPERCLLCEKLNSGLICKDCTPYLSWQKNSCPQCGIYHPDAKMCGRCISHPPFFNFTYACFSYQTPVSQWISNLKFQHKLYFAKLFARFLINKIQIDDLPDLIISVPLHKKRLMQRGFNQAHEVAKRVCKELNINYDARLVLRNKHRIPQAELDYKKRRASVRNIFEMTKSFSAKHIAIVDDVVTNGSTVNELAKLLKQHGAQRVDIFCIARTQKNNVPQ